MANGQMGLPMGQLLQARQRQQGLQQGLPAANPQGLVGQQAGGDPRRAMMMQMLQQRMGRGQQAPGGQQQLLGRMLAARGAQGRQGRMGRPGSPRQALMRRRMGRMAGNRRLLQKRLAQR